MLSAALLLALLAQAGPAGSWDKVRSLKSGTELRILKVDSTLPVPAVFYELTATNLVVVVKNEQIAIPRSDIERIDARQIGSRVNRATRSETRDQAKDLANRVPGHAVSVGSGISIANKPVFETVYRRPLDLKSP
jgi:hypothetical protein